MACKHSVIVGAGPTGLALAGEMHRLGVPMHLLETHAAPLPLAL